MAKKSIQNRLAAGENFPATLTSDQVEEYEARQNGSGDIAVSRRITLACLTRDSNSLVDSWKEPEMGEAMMDVLETIGGYIKHCETSLELAKAAQARLFMTGEIAHPHPNSRESKKQHTRKAA